MDSSSVSEAGHQGSRCIRPEDRKDNIPAKIWEGGHLLLQGLFSGTKGRPGGNKNSIEEI